MKTFFTPGPSQLYPTVPKHMHEALAMHIPSISHRSREFKEITREAILDIKKLLSIPEDYSVFFLSSATEAMERTIENCVIENSFHIIAGDFGKKFYEIAVALKKKPVMYHVGIQKNLPHVYDIPSDTELICITQNETSNGWSCPTEIIYKIKRTNPHMLMAVDIVSSAPYVDLDYTKIDIAFFSVQKGFGLPAGLGICIVSPDALRKSNFIQRSGRNIGSYHSFPQLQKNISDFQTPETPNVLNIFLLRKVVQDLLAIGIQNIRQETAQKAALIYNFLENHHDVSSLVPADENKSKTVIVARGNKLSELHEFLKGKNLIIGEGYGKEKHTQIRIANFPSHTMADVKILLQTIEDFYTQS